MNVRHILGISGGKDSAALAIYLKQKYPTLKIEYYNSDTGCELEETEVLINRLEAYLGKIERLRAAEGSPEPTPFHHFLKSMGGFLPSPQARWCTKKMKLDKFEEYVGDSESYAIHITKLEIFDEPKEISEFRVLAKGNKLDHTIDAINIMGGMPLTRAPESFCYIEID